MDKRKATVLRAVVESFIDTAQPVGSRAVSDIAGLDVSAATIRNEMASLEADGYLAQPHTSAGRIPTEAGYRYFVDSLGPGHLDDAEARQISAFFRHAQGQIEQRLVDQSPSLSTHCLRRDNSRTHTRPNNREICSTGRSWFRSATSSHCYLLRFGGAFDD